MQDRNRRPRVEGNEFAVLLTGVDLPKAKQVADLIRADVEGFHYEAEPDLRVTVSLGVAVAPIHGHDAEELLTKAQREQYTAKKEGRNRVSCAEAQA